MAASVRPMIVDGNNLLWRGVHATWNDDTFMHGMKHKTGGIHAAIRSLSFSVQRLTSMYGKSVGPIVVFFDDGASTARLKFYPAYKAHREKRSKTEQIKREDAMQQLSVFRQIIQYANITTYSRPGVEADDLMALSAMELAQASDRIKPAITTSDKDLWQLVSDTCDVYDTDHRTVIRDDHVIAKFGVSASYLPMLRAIVGDKSDNIPGAVGVGVSGASKIISRFLLSPYFFSSSQHGGDDFGLAFLDFKEFCLKSVDDPSIGRIAAKIIAQYEAVDMFKVISKLPIPEVTMQDKTFIRDVFSGASAICSRAEFDSMLRKYKLNDIRLNAMDHYDLFRDTSNRGYEKMQEIIW